MDFEIFDIIFRLMYFLELRLLDRKHNIFNFCMTIFLRMTFLCIDFEIFDLTLLLFFHEKISVIDCHSMMRSGYHFLSVMTGQKLLSHSRAKGRHEMLHSGYHFLTVTTEALVTFKGHGPSRGIISTQSDSD